MIKEVIQYLEEIAPPALQESYDNAGVIVGDVDKPVHGVLCCLDSTEAIVDEAIARNCNLIVAHHPIIFRGLKSLTGSNYVERVVIKAIQKGITIYAIHTNLDNILENGVNSKIAEKIGLRPIDILRKKPIVPGLEFPDNKTGTGIIATLPEPMDELAFLHQVRQRLKSSCIKYTALLGRPVKKVAICGGSGQFLLPDAIQSGADVFITGDFKYHEYFDADGKIVIADVGHFESEQFTPELLHEIITDKFRNFAACISETITNPIKYLV